MAPELETMVKEASLEIPDRQRCRCLKEILELSDTEMAYVLGVSVETLRNWLREENDAHAMESIRFHRLLNLTQLAKGVIRPDRLGHWVHHENRALGRVQPLNLLADAAGCEVVSTVLEDVRLGMPD
ncbi:MAG: hypothetical protein ACRD3T_00390 [Terriglobia bacterium]